MLKKIGLDSSVIFTILSKAIQGLGGVAMLLMVTRFLDKNEQGYYYTFGSILSLQIFFELGLMGIVTQFVAHEAAHLSWKNKLELTGDEYHLSRLTSIVRLSIQWFFLLGFIMLAALIVAGYLFFNHYNAQLKVSWQSPWIVLSFATAFILLVDVIFAILEGLGKIQQIAKIRFLQQIVNLCCVTVFLFGGFKLLSSGMALLISTFSVSVILVLSGNISIIKKLWSASQNAKVDYKKEVIPYQFKIAFSYVSGYFIYQFLNPVLFATQGPVIAGKMGATMAVLNGILVISISFMSTKVALFSNYVAKKNYHLLNRTYNKSLFVSTFFCAFGLLIFMAILAVADTYYPKFGDRFLSFWPVLFLCLTQVTNIIGFSQGYYLRSFKQEPFFLISIIIGLLSGLSTYLCSKYFNVTGLTIGYFIINGVVGFIWGCIIYSNKKKEWTKIPKH